MSLIGIFHTKKEPKKVSKAYKYTTIAKQEGITFFYFTPSDVDFENEIILGLIHEEDKWIKKEFPFPDIIINYVDPITKIHKEIYEELLKRIPFTSNPLGTKPTIYSKIKKDKDFSDYLIPYKLIKKPLDVFDYLSKYSKIIIKPISHHQPNKIIYIENGEENFIIKENENTINLSKIELFNYIVGIKKDNMMLMQRYISQKSNASEPFDFRIHLQKNENGKWQLVTIYPRIGFRDKFLNNNQNEITILFRNFLINLFKEEYLDNMKYLEVFALQFANHLEILYNTSFDELGIDIALDDDKKAWIYEVNWRPDYMLYKSKFSYNTLKYANFLVNHIKENNNDKYTTN